jgi:predicted dehydrogenase
MSCNNQAEIKTEKKEVQLVTLDPGHFHAALVQKSMYPDVNSVVHVYAPEGSDLNFHLERINGYNSRSENPTKWQERVYTGNDFFKKMISEKKGNVVVLSGNNQKKTQYINESLKAGFNVLADKPMVIDRNGFELLKQAFETAKSKNLLLYDIMTERFEITTVLQKEFSMLQEVFGTLEKGSADDPAVTKESVHHFYKYVSGSVLTRPAWFMDVYQQGEGIIDVTTHLVDLVQWECFPEQPIDYTKDIQLVTAKRWPTDMGLTEFKTITKLDSVPAYLKKDVVNDTMLKIFSNGEINYTLKGVHARVSVIWRYKAPEGAGDTHYSIMRGTKANLVIRQSAEQKYKPTLYIEPIATDPSYANRLLEQIKVVQAKYPGIELKKNNKGWEVIVPEKYKEGHEAHFARVTEKFLEYLKNKNMPAWEVPNMIAKYYTTTQALELAKKK